MGDQSPQVRIHQTCMMGEIAKLNAGSNGVLEAQDYQRAVDILLDGRVE